MSTQMKLRGTTLRPEVAAQRVDRVLGPLLRFERLDAQALQQMPGVLVGQLQPALCGPPPGYQPIGVGQKLAQRIPFVRRRTGRPAGGLGLRRARSSEPGTRSAPRCPLPPPRPRESGVPAPPHGRREPGSARPRHRLRPGRSRSTSASPVPITSTLAGSSSRSSQRSASRISRARSKSSRSLASSMASRTRTRTSWVRPSRKSTTSVTMRWYRGMSCQPMQGARQRPM